MAEVVWVEGMHTSGVWHPMYGPHYDPLRAKGQLKQLLNLTEKDPAWRLEGLAEYEDFRLSRPIDDGARTTRDRHKEMYVAPAKPAKPARPDSTRVRIKVRKKK